MNKSIKIGLHSLFVSLVGVWGVDYFFHLFFSAPMETSGYFVAKMAVYFLFSLCFLSLFDMRKNEIIKVGIAGIAVSLMWGMYYNIFPLFFDYYPAGIALNGLTFLGMGLLGTGSAFGVVHTLAFVGGYYAGKIIMTKCGTMNS